MTCEQNWDEFCMLSQIAKTLLETKIYELENVCAQKALITHKEKHFLYVLLFITMKCVS